MVYYRTAESGYAEIHAATRTVTSLSAFIALLHDTAHIPEWMDSVREVTVLAEPGQRSDLVHTLFRAPWPVSDRDMVTLSRYWQPTPCSLVLEISDRHQDLPEQKGHVRMFDVHTRWSLESLEDGITKIDYTAYANPSGNLPHWLANRATLQTTFRTLLALREELSSGRYRAQRVEGISPCPATSSPP